MPACGDRLSSRLLTDGVALQDDYVSPAAVRELKRCAERRRGRGEFGAARVGAERSLRREGIRGDMTCWLGEPLFAAERALLRKFEQLRLEVNREGWLGLFDLELHYAWYAPGTGYARHADQLDGSNERVVTLILYLNETWHAGAGGELRLFAADARYRDIEPIAGRLVCFLAAGREHEVLATREGRWSVSGWLRRRP